MDISDFLALTPQTLAAKQYEVLKKHTLQKLKAVSNYLEKDDFNSINAMLAAPDEDSDTRFINFSYENGEINDIGDILFSLEQLKNNSSDF